MIKNGPNEERGFITNRIVILVILTGLNLLNYVDRTVLAAVLPRVQDSLALNETKGGALATAFLVGYFVTSPIFGALSDKAKKGDLLSRRVLMAIGVLIWSGATYASGKAWDFPSMLAARAVVGVGEASYASVAPTIIDDMAPADRKGRWLAVFYLAIPVGSALGYVTGGILESAFHNWRTAFSIVGLPGVVLALTCLLIAEPNAKSKTEKPKIDWPSTLRTLVREPLYVRAVLGYCMFTFALGGFAHWAPKFIAVSFNYKLERASFVFGAILVVAGLIGTAIGGTSGDRRALRLSEGRLDRPLAASVGHLQVCAVGSAIGAPLALAAVLAPSPTTFFVCIFVCEAALFLSTSPINAALLLTVPPAIRASAMAVSIFAIHMLGDLWSPLLVGVVADRATQRMGMLLLPVAIVLSAVFWWVRKTPRVLTERENATAGE